MKNILKLNTTLTDLTDTPNVSGDHHPYQTIATFVLLDDKPNGNKQGVPYSEFNNIINSAVGMPIKMNFNGKNAEDHPNSIPIGVIQEVTEVTLPDDTHQLVAKAAIWKEEFPEEVDFLKTAFAANKAPGISYELGYNDSESIGGVQWLRKIITQAATFVSHPAYGNRTKLLAIAATDTQTLATTIAKMVIDAGLQLSDVIEALETISGGTPDDPLILDPFPLGSYSYASTWTAAYIDSLPDSSFAYIEPGGKKTDGKTDSAHRHLPYKDASGKVDLPHLRNALARLDQTNIPAAAKAAAKAKLEAAAKANGVGTASIDKGGSQMEEKELEALKATAAQVPTLAEKIKELEGVITTKDAEIKEVKDENNTIKLAALVDNRTRKLAEAGFTLESDAAKAATKKSFLASLTDEGFDTYLADIVAAKAAAAPATGTAGLALASRRTAMPKIEVPVDGEGSVMESLMGKVRSRDARNAYVNEE